MSQASATKPTSRYISAVCRRKGWVLAFWLTGVAASAAVYLSTFRIDNSVAIWFLEDDPELESYRSHNADFGEREWTYVWLQSESVFAPAFLRDLQQLCDRIESLENVTRVLSLTDVGGLRPGSGGLPIFEKFFAGDAGEVPGKVQAEELRQAIRGSPLWDGRVVAPDDDRFTIVAVQNANRIEAVEPYRIRLIDGIRDTVSDFPTILDFGIVGTTVVNAELNRAAKRDMLIYYTLIAAFVLIGGGVTLRRIRDVIVLCAVVLGTVFPIMGGIAALGLPFNLMTVMLPTLLVTVSVSYLIHFLSEFHLHRCGEGGQNDVPVAISETFRQLLRPGLWTTVTTAIGFASLTVSPVAPIRQIGFFAAAGIGLAWLNTIVMAPALLSVLWRSGAKAHSVPIPPESDGNRLLVWLAKPRPILALVLGVAMLAGASGVVRLEADTDYVKFFRPGSKVRNDYARLEPLGMPGSYLTVTVAFPENIGLADLARHAAQRRFEKSLRALPGVIGIQSLDGMVEQFASDLGGDSDRETHSLLLGSLLEMADSGRFPESEEFVTGDGRLLRLRVMTGPMSTRDINAFRDRLENLSASQPEGWEIAVTGTNVLWANMDAHVVRTQLLSVGITAALLLVLLPIVFRSLRLGILGFLVSFVPVLCTLGLMAWIGLPVNIATCLLGGVVIGLAVDDTIYFLSRVREGLLQGMPSADALPRAIGTTGRAMIKTSLILTGGFLTMAASDFLPSVYFGVFFAFSILVALLADLIVLPAMLRLADHRPARVTTK